MNDVTRDELIVEHLPLVHALARRYANRGEPLDDLVQVGTVGLIKAVDRFDSSRGSDLAAFAAPTILGEIRRHFRDKAWAVRVPRALQERHALVARAVEDVTPRLGRSPSVAEVAQECGLSEEDVLDAMAAGDAYRPLTLSPPLGDEEGTGIDPGAADPEFEHADDRVALRDGLEQLPARERLILLLRFREGLTQSEIAAQIGISQMHVSRLIRRALETLREEVADGVWPPPPSG